MSGENNRGLKHAIRLRKLHEPLESLVQYSIWGIKGLSLFLEE
ncbi:hypothetical protein [uncultured Bartonella sp.]|nr:hypothetical protein [uncultured Bartonella sp.]